jgi:diguanylate cyclase
MPGFTSFLPSYNATPEQDAEFLRQSLPLMMKNQVSTNPINYAIWYEYVSGNNGKLKEDLDTLLSSKQAISSEKSIDLYKKHVCNASVESFEKINAELKAILNDTSQSVNLAGEKVSKAENSFQETSEILQNTDNIDDIKLVLNQVVAETKLLAETSHNLKSKLDDANNEMEEMRKELTLVREAAITDSLTGLLNRRAFDNILLDLVDQSSTNSFSLVILDLDFFKKINDSFGHLVGDKVLRYIASIMKQQIAENHFAARYGGEEMAVIMPDTDIEKALEISENIRKAVEKNRLKRKDDGESIGKITLSAGITCFEPQDTVEMLIERADRALYQAKDNGRNQVVVAGGGRKN